MRVWYMSAGELRLENVEQSPQVGEVLSGREVTRVWPDVQDPFHAWRVLFEAGVLGATNLEERARAAGLWEPSELVLGYLRTMGFEVAHVAGESPIHQMVFRVRWSAKPESGAAGEGVFPLQALVSFAQRNNLYPAPQGQGTVVPLPALVTRPDGTLAGRGIAISKRLEEFMADEHNKMLPKDWTACLLNWAAYYAQVGGCDAEQFQALASKTFARVFEDEQVPR